MLRRIGLGLLALTLLLPSGLIAQEGRSSSHPSTRSSSGKGTKATSSKAKITSKRSSSSVPRKSTIAHRKSNGKIKRSVAAKNEFMKRTGYPKGRKGYVLDHIVPLECGGADVPSNMQWQTVQEAKIKDRSERNCRRE